MEGRDRLTWRLRSFEESLVGSSHRVEMLSEDPGVKEMMYCVMGRRFGCVADVFMVLEGGRTRFLA
jgi:hypothetical protein